MGRLPDDLKARLLARSRDSYSGNFPDQPLSFKQGRNLWRLTGRLWMKLEEKDRPTKIEAWALQAGLFAALHAKGTMSQNVAAKMDAAGAVCQWFPDWHPKELGWRVRKGKKPQPPKRPQAPGSQEQPQEAQGGAPKPDDVPEGMGEGEDAQEAPGEKPEKEKPKPPEPPKLMSRKKLKAMALEDKILLYGRAYLNGHSKEANICLVGPAGCGKTTCSELAAQKAQMAFRILCCNKRTPAHEFTGRYHPLNGELEWSDFTTAYISEEPTLILLDEFEKLDPGIAAVANAALANGFLQTPNGYKTRGAQNIIVVAQNTLGLGADREYVAANQLDAATRDRFSGRIIMVDYSKEWELEHTPEMFRDSILQSIWKARDHVTERGYRRIVSTRMLLACVKLAKAGIPWREQITMGWSPQETSGLTL